MVGWLWIIRMSEMQKKNESGPCDLYKYCMQMNFDLSDTGYRFNVCEILIKTDGKYTNIIICLVDLKWLRGTFFFLFLNWLGKTVNRVTIIIHLFVFHISTSNTQTATIRSKFQMTYNPVDRLVKMIYVIGSICIANFN